MKKTVFFLIITVISAMFALSFSSACAQDDDLDSMSDEQLMLLLQAITQKLEERRSGSETTENPGPETVMTPAAVNDPETVLTAGVFQIYKNKKLIIERLPSYMFDQPSKGEEEPDIDDPGKKKQKETEEPPSCPVGVQCVDDDWYCRWDLYPDGSCRCMCG